MGYYRNISQNLETSIEGYVKHLENQLSFDTGADLIANESIETDVFQGEGLAYGLELFARKRSGRLNGWSSYTWSRSLLKVASPFQSQRINNGEFFPSNFDQPHSFNTILNYEISRRYSLTTNFTYRTGRPITLPTGQYSIGGVQNINYSTRNKFRIPDYWRWDVAINIEGNHKIKKLAHSSWTFSIYNLLGRDNVFSVFFEREGRDIESYKLIVFGSPIPSITYNLKF